MAEEPVQKGTQVRAPQPSGAPLPPLRAVWQAPALLAAVVLLGMGVVVAVLTAPKPDAARYFEQAQTLIEREDFQGALDILNKRVRPYYEGASLTTDQTRLFHLMRGRAVYLGQQRAGVDLEANAKTVVDEFTSAASKGAKLDARDTFQWADANVSLGRFDKALELAGKLPPTERIGRGRILKRIVEKQIAARNGDPDQLLKLLGDFLRDADATPADRAWALAREGDLLMRRGQNDAAITRVLQTLPALLSDAPPDALGDLYLLLGRAYLETGALAEAGKRLDQAAQLLLPSDPRRASAMVLQGRVAEQVNPDPSEGKTEAKQKFTEVIEQFAGTEARLPALLGLGEVEAGIGDVEASVKAYTELVQEMAAGKHSPDLTVQSVTTSLLDRARARLGAGGMVPALRYAQLAERLYKPEAVPPELLLLLAQAHRKAAEELLGSGERGPKRLVELSRVDPAIREQAREHLVAAGAYFKRHSEQVGVENNAGFGESLWLAADCVDLAGDAEQAIPLFADYAKYFPGDPKQPEARYRLGQAYQARGDYGTAADLYRGLIEDAGKSGSNAGPFADESYVPLAQCLLMNPDPSDDGDAEKLLERVAVQGSAGGNNTAQFRDGLVELAGVKSRRGDYAGAIQHLEEAVARFADDPRADEIRYNLADAYRQDARAIRQTLTQGMPDRQRQLLEQARLDRLHKAQAGFDHVREALEGRDPRQLSKLEQLQLRNSYFYLGDCAFDLKDFDAAIHHYDAARERYPNDPASLVAMVQIVNAYVEQGDLERAKTANERAMRFRKSLPDSVWADPNLPMTQEEWARWLDSMQKLMAEHAKTAAANPGDPQQ